MYEVDFLSEYQQGKRNFIGVMTDAVLNNANFSSANLTQVKINLQISTSIYLEFVVLPDGTLYRSDRFSLIVNSIRNLLTNKKVVIF